MVVRAFPLLGAPAGLAIRICINRSLSALQHVDHAPAITRHGSYRIWSLLSLVSLGQARHALASWILVLVA